MSEKKIKALRKKLRSLYPDPKVRRYIYKLAKKELKNA